MSNPTAAGWAHAGSEQDFYLVPWSDAPLDIPALALQFAHAILDGIGVPAWLGGGFLRDAVRGEQPKDIDVFFGCAEDHAAALARLTTHGAKVVRDLPVVVSLDTPFGRLDLVRKYSDGPLATIRSFDFIACCAAVSRLQVAYHARFVQQARAKVLRFNACPNPGPSVRRAVRFLEAGWSMLGEDARQLALRGAEPGEVWSDPGGEDGGDDAASAAEVEAGQERACRRLLELTRPLLPAVTQEAA